MNGSSHCVLVKLRSAVSEERDFPFMSMLLSAQILTSLDKKWVSQKPVPQSPLGEFVGGDGHPVMSLDQFISHFLSAHSCLKATFFHNGWSWRASVVAMVCS